MRQRNAHDKQRSGETPTGNRISININNEQDVRHWTKKLGCTTDELIAAVSAVGSAAAPEYLKKQRKPLKTAAPPGRSKRARVW